MLIKNQITMELKMESFQKLNSVMLILHHLIEQKIVLIPIACTMEAIDINNNSKLPKVKSHSLIGGSFHRSGWLIQNFWNFPSGYFQLGLLLDGLICIWLAEKFSVKIAPSSYYKMFYNCIPSSAVIESCTIRNTSLYSSWPPSR